MQSLTGTKLVKQAQKQKLVQPPVLSYPQFRSSASPIFVYTDASNVGLGTVPEQEYHVIGYASRMVTKANRLLVSEWKAY